MYCHHCGTKLPDDARFCSRCGKAMIPPAAPVKDQGRKSYTTGWRSDSKGPAAPMGERKEDPNTTSWSQYTQTPAAPTEGRVEKFLIAKKLLAFAKSHKLVTAVCCVVLVFVAMSVFNDIYFSIENAKIAARKEAAQASQSSAVSNSSGKASSSSSGGGSSSAGSSKSAGGTVKADKSSTAVPDLGEFLGCAGRDTKSGETYSYTFDDDKGLMAVDEYRALLTGSYNFKEVNFKKEEYPSSGLICYNIYYSYTGSGSVGSQKWPSAEQEANIYLLVNHYTWEDRVGVSMSLGDGLTVENSGVTASDPPADMSGAGGSGSGSGSGGSGGGVTTPEFAKLDCSICKGSGDCQTCGGRGYLYSSASKKYDRNCTSCNTSRKCRYCGGTGKR